MLFKLKGCNLKPLGTDRKVSHLDGTACTTQGLHIRSGSSPHIWNFPCMESNKFRNVKKKNIKIPNALSALKGSEMKHNTNCSSIKTAK